MRDWSVKIVVLFLLPAFVYLAPLPFTPLMEPDEGRYSLIPSEMNESGDYVTPRLKHAVYFEKPPLAYWATAVLFQLFGENEFASRLFAALCAWGLVLLVYRIGRHFHDEKTGLYAAAVLTTFLYHIAIGRINILDMPLAFFVCVAIWSGYRGLCGERRRRGWLVLLYLFSALSFLAKGLIGIAFPFGVLLTWLLLSGRWRRIPGLFSVWGVIVLAAVTLPWLVLVQRQNPDFFRFFFIQEHFLRYATKLHDRYQPVWFFVPILLAGTLPWCAFLPEAIRGLPKGTRWFDQEERRLLVAWFGLIFLFFSLSSSKLIPYIAPVFVPVALAFGHLFRLYGERPGPAGAAALPPPRYRITGILQALLFVAVLAVPLFLSRHRVSPAGWLPWTVLPLLIQLAILVLPDRMRRRGEGAWFGAIAVLFALYVVALTPLVSQFLSPYKSARPLADAIRERLPAGETPYQYGMSLYGIDFYTGMRTPIVDDIGEVRYGSEQLPDAERRRYFLDSNAFFALVAEKDGIYCATENNAKLERLRKEVPTLRVLWHNHAFALVRLTKTQDKGM